MSAQFRWDGTPLSLPFLDSVAGDLSKLAKPGTARFNFTINSIIIRHFLGDDWFRENLLPDARPDSFFRPDFSNTEADPRYSALTLELAENLLNLQSVRGFHRCLDHMAPRQMQSGLAELQIGQVLRLRGVPFRYIEENEPTTVDLMLQAPSGDECLGEIKCKYEEVEYSDRTLTDALATARKQIGKGNSGVVFVKVPLAWVDVLNAAANSPPDIRLPARIVAAAKAAMLQSARIKKVIFYVFHHAFDPNWGLSATHATMEMTNPQLSEISPWRGELLNGEGTWVRMPDLAKR
jgi:hypothetical protein